MDQGSPLTALMARFIQDCQRQVLELKSFPMDAIAESASPNAAENDALKKARQAAKEAADMLAAGCPKDAPAEPAARLDSIDREISAVEAALNAVRLPLQAFYDLLHDDQKARLEARFVSPVSRGAVAETTGSGSRKTAAPSRHHRKISHETADAPADPAAVGREWDCAQWEAELRAWPIARVERALTIGPRQRAAIYDFAAALQRSADKLADSCVPEIAPTPIGRIGERIARLEAIRQSAAAIQPVLGRLYNALDSEQKARLGAAL